MQDFAPFLLLSCLLALYGIYLAIAALISDFVYFLTGSAKTGRIEIKTMDSQRTRIKTSITGILWVVAATFISLVATQGKLFHILAQAGIGVRII
jgi:uncharacterized membrane protein